MHIHGLLWNMVFGTIGPVVDSGLAVNSMHQFLRGKRNDDHAHLR